MKYYLNFMYLYILNMKYFSITILLLQNLLYKLQRKIKVFNTNNSLANRGYNLVACTSKYGIVFIASPNGMLSGKLKFTHLFSYA